MSRFRWDRLDRLQSPSRSVYKWLHGGSSLLRSTRPPAKPQPRRLARLAARRSPLRTARRPVLAAACFALAAAPLSPTPTAQHGSLTPPQPRRRAAADRTASRRPASSLARSLAGRRPARGARRPGNIFGVSLPVYTGHIRPFTHIYKQNVGDRLYDLLPISGGRSGGRSGSRSTADRSDDRGGRRTSRRVRRVHVRVDEHD